MTTASQISPATGPGSRRRRTVFLAVSGALLLATVVAFRAVLVTAYDSDYVGLDLGAACGPSGSTALAYELLRVSDGDEPGEPLVRPAGVQAARVSGCG